MEKTMKVLWIINITMPDACEALGKPRPVIGGWLTGYCNALLKHYPDVELHIVEPYWEHTPRQLSCQWHSAGNEATVTHHLFPQSWLQTEARQTAPMRSRLSAISNRMTAHFAELADDICPDVVHLHGTEFPHALAWIEANGNEHTIASIQGLASEYAKVFMSGLTPRQQRCSLSDWRHGFSLAKENEQLRQRGVAEVALLQKIDHVAGRTQWDQDCALQVNPSLRYHTLQEVLRQEFYDQAGLWSHSQCSPHTIFVSQSHYPIKGLHQLLKALPIVIALYPDTQVRIVGNDITCKRWWQRSTYGNLLHSLIEAHSLRSHITYLGALTAEQMVKEYSAANVFVCPSRIENSCNSVCEAQLLGTPVVAANVGGMATLIAHQTSGLLYDFADTQALADCICQLFADAALCSRLSQQASRLAQQRHNREEIAHTLYNIYKEL